MIDLPPTLRQLDRDGYALVPGIIPADECQTWRVRLAELAETSYESGVRQRRNRLYAVRNLIDVCPELPQLWQRTELLSLLTSLLGPGFGLVRGLLFDKPPDLTWAVPWHQDRTIVIERPTDLSPLY